MKQKIMKTIAELALLGESDRMVVFTDAAPDGLSGIKLPIFAPGGGFSLRFNYKIDMKNKTVIEPSDPKFKTSKCPDLNKLIDMGIIKEWFPYREASIWDAKKQGYIYCDGKLNVEKIQAYFKEQGFTLSKEAIMHNYNAWRLDLKSGFRDEANNVHLFSPCGCNPFNLHVTELCDMCDWQTTYTC